MPAERKRLRGTLKASRERRRAAQPVSGHVRSAALVPEPKDYLAIGRQYALDVVTGVVVACLFIRLLAGWHLRQLERAKDSTHEYVFSDWHVVDACAFCEKLPLALGENGLLRLRPVQCFLLMIWFGWRMRADVAVRRFRFIYLEVARKFGKSTLASAILLYVTFREGEHGARTVIAATAGHQTGHVFDTARYMAGGEYLQSLGIQVFKRAIVHEASNSKIEALNSRAHSLHGENPSCCVIDELHEVPHDLFNVLRTSFGARKNPLLLVLTTAGRDVLGIAYETRTRAIKSLQGVLEDDRLCGAIFCLDDGDAWTDEHVWPKANPMLDDPTPTLSELRQLALEAKATPSQELSFRQFYTNEWLAISASAWLSVDDIRRCADSTLRLDDVVGAKVWIGFDSALKDDSASVAIITLRDGILYMFNKSFLPRDSVARYAKLIPEYVQWVREGLLEPTDGAIVDLARIREYIVGLHERFHVQAVVIEQFAAGNLPSDLLRLGIKAEVSPKNARVFTPSALDLEARIRSGLFRFDGNSHATWMLSNACVERRRDGSLLPTKDHEKSVAKIDIVDATLLAMIPMLAEPEPVISVYDRKDFDVSMVLV
jgi:phage terminase large subunit-like protein